MIPFNCVFCVFLESVSNAFECQDGGHFDYVINCAAETKAGQTETVCVLIRILK